MYFDNLNLTEERRRRLELDLNDLYDDYVDTLGRLEKDAANLVSGMVWDGESESDVRAMMERYADAANRLAADYYQNVRDIWEEYSETPMIEFEPVTVDANRAVWQIEKGFANTEYNGLTYKQVMNGQARSGVTIDDLWPSFAGDYMKAYTYASEIVRVTARLTVMRSAVADPTQPKYARVPSGPYTCAFCVMCASRGFDYSSAETAGKYKAYHPDCDCRIIPSWGAARLRRYDYRYYKAMYDAAAARSPSMSANDVCAEMRRLFPERLTDGSFNDNSKFTKDNSLRYGIWRAERIKAMRKYTALQPATDLIPSKDPAEAPEWPEDLPAIMRAKEWNHILYGGYGGGGHLHGYGWQYESTAEFPDTWDADKIRDAGIAILGKKENREHIAQLLAEGKTRGSVTGIIDGVAVRVAFSKAGGRQARVTSIHPIAQKGA